MRLTLRTLLAYLDDTLEPSQAKLIGQKVAESDAAQELMARIRQVTRRRRLTTPPAGSKTEGNTIAEYLDNTLPAEQLAEIEETCLASDVHLAEIAACHQILTLVLGEPALVPPTAKQRMYGLVKGREAIPFRKPAAALDAGDGDADDGHEADETLRLGLPAYRRSGNWNQRLAIIGGVLALAALLAVAIWQLLPPGPRNQPEKDGRAAADAARTKDAARVKPVDLEKDRGAKAADQTNKDGTKPSDKPDRDQANKDGKPRDKAGDGRKNADKANVEDGDTDKAVKGRDKAGKDKAEPDDTDSAVTARPIKNAPPRVVGRYVPPAAQKLPAILLRRAKGEDNWKRLERNALDVSTGDRLVSLPGYRSDVRFDNGLQLTLWGDLPELSLVSPYLESVVVLHDPGDNALDLTLDRGRVLITNGKRGTSKVLVRFDNPSTMNGRDAWGIDLLDPDTIVALELWGRHMPGVVFDPKKKNREGPESEMYLFVLKGSANVRVNEYRKYGMEAPPSDRPGMLLWNSRQGDVKPEKIRMLPDWAFKTFPPFPPKLDRQTLDYLEDMRAKTVRALEGLSANLSGVDVEAGLDKVKQSRDLVQRMLAMRCYGAINDLSNLLDGLVDSLFPEVRQASIEDLRHWIGLHFANESILYRALLEKKYTHSQATSILQMLHSFSEKDRAQPETYARLIDYLRQDSPALRVLAHWHLIRMVPKGMKIPYDPLGPDDQIDKAYEEWKKLVPEGSLPRAPRAKPMGKKAK